MAVAINSIYSRNNVQATVVAYNSKFKTVVLKFEDGKEQSISTATLTKHWVEVPTNEVPTQEVTIIETPKDYVKVEPIEEAPKAEVPMETVIEVPVEKAPKAKKVKVSKEDTETNNLLDVIAAIMEEAGVSFKKHTKHIYFNKVFFYAQNNRVRVYVKNVEDYMNKYMVADSLYDYKKTNEKTFLVLGDQLEAFVREVLA